MTVEHTLSDIQLAAGRLGELPGGPVSGLLASADPGHHTARHDLGGKRDRRNLHLTVRAFDTGARP